MPDIIARLRSGKLIFETMVDLDASTRLKKGEAITIDKVIKDNQIYKDLKKGMVASNQNLIDTFSTTNFEEIVEKIVKKGMLEVTQDYRDKNIEIRKKQIIDFLVKNSIDSRTNHPFTPDIINSAIEQSKVKIEDKSVEKQVKEIIEKLKKIIPIKIETKKIKVIIPAEHTGKIYGLIQEYKEKENWISNGDLEVILNIPIGLIFDFYDKLNSITHGSTIVHELN